MKTLLLFLFALLLHNYSNCQNDFDQCAFFEEFLNELDFERIPYFKAAYPKPYKTIENAGDTLIARLDYETYEQILINEKELLTKEWAAYNESNKFVSQRDKSLNSFHLISFNLKYLNLENIIERLSTYSEEIKLDSLTVLSNNTCHLLDEVKNERFVLNKSFKKLSEKELYNLRGIFSFGEFYITSDKKHVITTFDIYHKWISYGKRTEMETN